MRTFSHCAFHTWPHVWLKYKDAALPSKSARPPGHMKHETLDQSKAAEQMSRCIKSRPSYKPVVHIGEGREKAKTGRNFTPTLIQRINAPPPSSPTRLPQLSTSDWRLQSVSRCLSLSLTQCFSVSLFLALSRRFSLFYTYLSVPACFSQFLSVSCCFALVRSVSPCFDLFRPVLFSFVQFCFVSLSF